MSVRTLLLWLATAFLLVFCVFPVALLLVKSFQAPGDAPGQFAWSFRFYQAIFSRESNLLAMQQTLLTALLATLVSVALALPFAFLLARTDLPAKGLLRTLIMIPYMMPPFVGAIAWIYLASPKIGYLNRLTGEPWINIYSLGGLVWVLAVFDLPRAFLGILRAFERLDPVLEEAAAAAGARPVRVVRTITLPLLAPSILAGAFLVFIAAASAFGVPALIGMPAKITLVTTKIVQAVYVGSPQALRESWALASVLMGLALLALNGSNLVLAGRDYAVVGGKAGRSQLIELGRWRRPVFALCLLVSVVLGVLPIIAILATTFLRSVGLDLLAPDNWTLRNWTGVLGDNKTWNTLRVSLIAAAAAATVAVAVGGLIAYLRVRVPGRWAKAPDLLASLGSATPGTVVALGMIIAFSGAYGLNLYGTLAILIVAYLVRDLAIAVRTVGAALQQLHPALEEAALASGATWLQMMRDITIPLLSPALIAAWFLVFIPSLYELTMSVLLYSAGTQTIGVYLYEMQSYADPQAAAVLSAVLLALVLAGNAVLRWLTAGRAGV